MLLRLLVALAFCVAPLSASSEQATPAPKGWHVAGSKPADYSAGVGAPAHSGKDGAQLHSVAPQPTGFGTLMQNVDASLYRGKRLRMTAFVKSVDVAAWAGLWMRVDGSSGVLSFDNMSKRPIKGKTEWAQYSVVLDVPDTANRVAFGVLLQGSGSVSVDDFAFETVGSDVPTTGGRPGIRDVPVHIGEALPKSPQNLSFEQ